MTMGPTNIPGMLLPLYSSFQLPLFFFPNAVQAQLQPLHHQQPDLFSTIHWSSQHIRHSTVKKSHVSETRSGQRRIRCGYVRILGVLRFSVTSVYTQYPSSPPEASFLYFQASMFIVFSSELFPNNCLILTPFSHSSNSCADAG